MEPTNTQPASPEVVSPEPHQPTPEEIEHAKKVMHDSLAARKPKGFLENLKEWFQ